MNNIKILDCTLRDGGRIIDCEFPTSQSKRIIYSLQQANIDIIEVGFLRDEKIVKSRDNTTFFTSINQMVPLLPKERKSMFVAFVDFGMFSLETLEQNDGVSIDGIRFGFTKKDFENSLDQIIYNAQLIKDKGYKLFLQGVNSLAYTDLQFLKLIDSANNIEPYSFGIVDTYGAMYVDDLQRIYSLVNHNLDSKITVDFHSHNNFQLSFSFAQEIIKLSDGVRNVIIDSTLRGMGKGAGNTNTELIVDYLVRKKGYPYDLEKILEIIDLDIYDIYEKKRWGYSPASFMAGIYKSHPNNIIYLLDKYSFTTNDIKNILAMLSDKERQQYPYDRIDQLCKKYCLKEYDDKSNLQHLQEIIGNKKVLILAPGKTLLKQKETVDLFIKRHKPFIISVNFIADYRDSIPFFGNKKRYHSFCYEKGRKVIVTSDIATGSDKELVISAKRLCPVQDKDSNSSVLKLLNLLHEVEVYHIAIAGMDGFTNDMDNNYYDKSLTVNRTLEDIQIINARWQKNLDDFQRKYDGMHNIQLITASALKVKSDFSQKTYIYDSK